MTGQDPHEDARAIPLDDLFTEFADADGDLSPNRFARVTWDRYRYTVEHARAVIYALQDQGRIVITDRFALRRV